VCIATRGTKWRRHGATAAPRHADVSSRVRLEVQGPRVHLSHGDWIRVSYGRPSVSRSRRTDMRTVVTRWGRPPVIQFAGVEVSPRGTDPAAEGDGRYVRKRAQNALKVGKLRNSCDGLILGFVLSLWRAWRSSQAPTKLALRLVRRHERTFRSVGIAFGFARTAKRSRNPRN